MSTPIGKTQTLKGDDVHEEHGERTMTHPADTTTLAGTHVETIIDDGRDGLYLSDSITRDGHAGTFVARTTTPHTETILAGAD